MLPSPPPIAAAGAPTTRPANTTAYGFGNLIANSTTAASVLAQTIALSRGGLITRARLQKTGTSLTNALFRLHLYAASPTVTNGDGAQWLSNSSANYLGSLDITVDKAMSDGAIGLGNPTTGYGIAIPAAATLYYLLEARNTYTPVSGEVFTPTLEVQ